MKLDELFTLLNSVLPNKVFYGSNIYDNGDNSSMPFIVYEEINKRPIGYHDDSPIIYERTIQITLVSKRKSVVLENALEKNMTNTHLNYSLISEFFNEDRSINRVYEIKLLEEK